MLVQLYFLKRLNAPPIALAKPVAITTAIAIEPRTANTTYLVILLPPLWDRVIGTSGSVGVIDITSRYGFTCFS